MKVNRLRAGCCLAACVIGALGCGTGAGEGWAPSAISATDAKEYRSVCQRFGDRLTLEQRTEALHEIYIAPLREQLPQWRALGYCAANETLQSEALRELAWLGDGQCVSIAAHALSRESHAVRAAAAQALAHHASPDAHAAKASLRAALEVADESDERQLVWALVVLEDEHVFPRAIELWSAGKLTTVRGIDGHPAFDPERVARLAPQRDLTALADDPQPAIRSMAATLLAHRSPPSPLQRLHQLLADEDISVAAPAAAGLARLDRQEAKQAVIAQLRAAGPERRTQLLEALRDGAGGPGLVLALDAVVSDPEQRRWFQFGQVFRMMAELADPRVADPLNAWLERNEPHLSLHWQAEAALRLAEVGDVRGAKILGKRMAVDSGDLYDRAKPWQVDRSGHLSRGDSQRIAAARLLGDLALLHPDRAELLAAAAGASVLAWTKSRVLPHAHGLRFLAAIDYEPAREPIHAWAFPDMALPKRGAGPPLPMQFEVVSSALRAMGQMRAAQSPPLLTRQFDRKDRSFDMRQSARSGRSRAMLALALRNIGRGAAQGLSHWGQAAGGSARNGLRQVIEDPTWHADVRLAACHALAFVADEPTIERLVGGLGRAPTDDSFTAACYAETLARRARPTRTQGLIAALRRDLPAPARMSLGHAIGRSGWLGAGMDAVHEPQLLEMLSEPERRQPAALALMLGGSSKAAVRAALTIRRTGPREQQAFRTAFESAVATVYARDLELGSIHQWVENAEAIRQVTVDGKRLTWPAEALTRQLRSLELDAGPHTLTLPVLRYRLLVSARAGRAGALHTLCFMGERGALMALAAEGGMVGRHAQQALRRAGVGRWRRADARQWYARVR